MKYLSTTAVLAVLLALTVSSHASADHEDHVNPPCADIVNGIIAYSGFGVFADVQTRAPSCPGLQYTLTVLDNPDSASPLAVGETQIVGGPSLRFSVPVTAPDTDVCIYVTSTAGSHESHLFDRAPDQGCLLIPQCMPPAATQATPGIRPCAFSFD